MENVYNIEGYEVYVNEYVVGIVKDGYHPVGADYYRDEERGYGCKTDREIAEKYIETMRLDGRI